MTTPDLPERALNASPAEPVEAAAKALEKIRLHGSPWWDEAWGSPAKLAHEALDVLSDLAYEGRIDGLSPEGVPDLSDPTGSLARAHRLLTSTSPGHPPDPYSGSTR